MDEFPFLSSSEGKYTCRRRSFSSIEESLENSPRPNSLSKDAKFNPPVLMDVVAGEPKLENEERMDMLWEDFNDIELRGTQGLDVAITASGSHSVQWHGAMGVSKSGRTAQGSRRPGFLFVLKVLRKLFAVQRTSSAGPRHHLPPENK